MNQTEPKLLIELCERLLELWRDGVIVPASVFSGDPTPEWIALRAEVDRLRAEGHS